MRFLNAITIAQVTVGMYGMHKLYVPHLEHRRWMRIEICDRI